MLPGQLPPLREDLHLLEAAPHHDGSPAWMVHDPVNNQFYRIGWLEFEMLSRWHLQQPGALLADLRANTPLQATEEELQDVFDFLRQHLLLTLHSPAWTDHLVKLYRRSRTSKLTWLLHHYLFFRVPLWRPDRFLARTMPWLAWLFTPLAAWTVVGLGLLGVALVARQWESFAASFVETLSPTGLLGYLAALAVAKSLHELGHAFVATRHGVRVAHMGMAFLVMWPVLYTDTSESWRLRDRRQRLAIASAGVLTELALAALATLAWSLTAPGELRQALLFLATTAWVISLGLNASPFMRFDGYFILSDLLDIPNLHERATALARHGLRHWLLGWDDPLPEELPQRMRRGLMAFAYVTWIYRLVVFTGIAVAVYLMFFKLLGLFLFLVEIGWFVIKPIMQELVVWRQRSQDIRPNRRRWAMLFVTVLGGLLFLPWNLHVQADGWMHGAQVHAIYSPVPARIERVGTNGQSLAAGEAAFVLSQPDLSLRRELATQSSNSLERQLAGLGDAAGGEERRPLLEQLHTMRRAEAQAADVEAARLHLTAPMAGRLLDVEPDMGAGVWVGPRQSLGVVVQPDGWQAEVFVSATERERLQPGAVARFYPQDNPAFPIVGRVRNIDTTRLVQLPHSLLATVHGGHIPTMPEHAGTTQVLAPRDVLYRVRIELQGSPDWLAVRRGVAVIDATPRSWLWDASKSLLLVLVREATF